MRQVLRRHAKARAPLALVLLAAIAAFLPASGFDGNANALEHDLASRPAASGDALGGGFRLLAYSKAYEEATTAGPEAVSAGPAPVVDFIWPVDGWIVQGMWAGHPGGIDIGAPPGDPVRAVRAGTVAFAGGDRCCEYGYFVVIAHDDGWSTLYGHLSAFSVKAGQQVKQGQEIGRVGTTGKSSGPHVHLELRSFGGVVNPLDYLYPRRVAPPPDPEDVARLYASRSQPLTAAAPPPAPPPPAPTPATPVDGFAGLTPGQVAAFAANWLESRPDATYDIDPSSCLATPRGPNWAVTCLGNPVGCNGSVCTTSLTACVYEQPFLISTSCP